MQYQSIDNRWFAFSRLCLPVALPTITQCWLSAGHRINTVQPSLYPHTSLSRYIRLVVHLLKKQNLNWIHSPSVLRQQSASPTLLHLSSLLWKTSVWKQCQASLVLLGFVCRATVYFLLLLLYALAVVGMMKHAYRKWQNILKSKIQPNGGI